MSWENKEVNIGVVKPGTRHTIEFKSTIPLEIIDIQSSCSCSKPTYDAKKYIIKVSYVAKAIPYHKIRDGFYKTKKFVTLTYKGGKKEQLKFTATVKK